MTRKDTDFFIYKGYHSVQDTKKSINFQLVSILQKSDKTKYINIVMFSSNIAVQ